MAYPISAIPFATYDPHPFAASTACFAAGHWSKAALAIAPDRCNSVLIASPASFPVAPYATTSGEIPCAATASCTALTASSPRRIARVRARSHRSPAPCTIACSAADCAQSLTACAKVRPSRKASFPARALGVCADCSAATSSAPMIPSCTPAAAGSSKLDCYMDGGSSRRFAFVVIALRPTPGVPESLDVLLPRGGVAPRAVLPAFPWPDEALDAATKALGGASCRLRTLDGETRAIVVDLCQSPDPHSRRPNLWVPLHEVLANRGPWTDTSVQDTAAVSSVCRIFDRLALSAQPTEAPMRVLYHGTSSEEAARSILATGLRKSAHGMFGPVAYLASFRKASRFALWDQEWKPRRDPWVVRCMARLGPRVVRNVVDPKESDPCCKCTQCRRQPTGKG